MAKKKFIFNSTNDRVLKETIAMSDEESEIDKGTITRGTARSGHICED